MWLVFLGNYMEKIRITESELKKAIHDAILNEISQQTKASAFVKGNRNLDNLRNMKAKGETTFSRNGRMFDVDNEIKRRGRQQDTFGNGLAHDLSLEYGKDRERHRSDIEAAKSEVAELRSQIKSAMSGGKNYNGELEYLKDSLKRAERKLRSLLDNTNGYNVRSSSNGGYYIETPNGHAYSNGSENGIMYNDGSSSNVTRLGKMRDITDAMSGYDDELSGRMDNDVRNLKRRQRNVRALRDYDDAYSRWKHDNERFRRAQQEYDEMSPLNPKKWFSKRHEWNMRPPQKPSWEPNDNGEFDGYFAHKNPDDYNKDIDAVRNRQKNYRDAKDRYFKKMRQ